MSLQARMRGAVDWYAPERDLANNFHTIMRMALERLESVSVPEPDKVALLETSARLARLVTACSKGAISEEDMVGELKNLNPLSMMYIGRELLVQQFLLYRKWRHDVAPKRRAEDGPIIL